MKRNLLRIIISAVIFAVTLILNPQIKWLTLTLYIVAYAVVGYDVVIKAVRNIFYGRVFDEHFLMAVASIGAFLISEYPEAVAVMLFYQVGELFQDYAVSRSRKSIASLMDIRPDHANMMINGEMTKVNPSDVKIGDIIIIKSGERIPLDAVVIDGTSAIDTHALTGEPIPKTVGVGDEILSGCVNMSGLLTARVISEYGDSTVSRILNLVENASEKKAKSENFITKFAKIYTPIVVISALLLAVIPPVITSQSFSDWIYRALNFLVVSCPCALVVSVPLSFFGGIGGASLNGILIKGSNFMERLAKAQTAVFDKTGTLTKGVFEVAEIHPIGITSDELIYYTAHAESFIDHPISQSIQRAFGGEIDRSDVSESSELAGYGVVATVGGKRIAVGNYKLMQKEGISLEPIQSPSTTVYTSIDGVYAGYIVISDIIKSDAKEAISALRKLGVKNIVMLTGDNDAVGQSVSEELGIDKAYTELLPDDKVRIVGDLISQTQGKGSLIFTGDGINDAPVLAGADVGVSMGKVGSQAAIEASDVVIMTDEPSKLAKAISISKRTLGIAYQNIVFAIAIKVLVLVLSALGITTMWAAVFADVGVTVLAVLNALRALRVKI